MARPKHTDPAAVPLVPGVGGTYRVLPTDTALVAAGAAPRQAIPVTVVAQLGGPGARRAQLSAVVGTKTVSIPSALEAVDPAQSTEPGCFTIP